MIFLTKEMNDVFDGLLRDRLVAIQELQERELNLQHYLRQCAHSLRVRKIEDYEFSADKRAFVKKEKNGE